MFLSKLSINRPVLTTMLISVFLLFGIIAYRTLNINQTPEVEIPFVTITTIYPGAGPKEIETQISKELEDAVATVSEIKTLESYSLDGVSIVTIEFELGKDIDVAHQEVKNKVDGVINELPKDSEDPLVEKVDLQQFPIIDVILSGEVDLRALYEFADKDLKDRLAQIKGVARVNLVGGQEREIHVKMDDRVVYENKISLAQLIQMLGAQNMDLPGGYFQRGEQEYTVRMKGDFPDVQTIKDLEIPTASGPKKISQFADVLDTGETIRQRAVYFDNDEKIKNTNVVRISLIKSSEGNAVQIAENVQEALPEIRKILPEGSELQIVNDRSIFIRSTFEDTMSNVILGVVFTSLVLLIFLHNFRSTFIVALSMPTSIISTFLLFQAFDMTMNMMSLMGLSVSVGVLVANSVVVLENIFRYKYMGKDKKEAAEVGTNEIAVAVIASTFTNVAVFLPLATMSSIVGEFLQELALAAVFATIFSLLMSFTLTPMLASIILPRKQKIGRISQAIDKFEKMWNRLYEKSLQFILKNRKISGVVVLISVILLALSVMFWGSKLGFEFMPVVDDGKIRVTAELPEGYNLEATADAMDEIRTIVTEHDIVTHTVTNLGKMDELNIGTNLASMEVHMVDASDRDIGIQDFIQVLIEELSVVSNARIQVQTLEQMGGPGDPIEFYLLGQELDTLRKYREIIIDSCKDVAGLINFDNSWRAGKPELTVTPKRKMLSEVGMSVQELAITLRAAVEGFEAAEYSELGNEYDIKVTLSDESVNSPEKLGTIPIVTQTGNVYRLAQLANINFTTGYTKIIHRDKYTTIKFSGAPAAGVPLGTVIDRLDDKFVNIEFPSGYRIQWGGSAEMFQQMVSDFIFAFFLATILTYMLLAAILESFVQPIIILTSLPLALIGSFGLLYYTGTTMNITSMMGIIMLIGIVVNNAILILDYTNQLRREEEMSSKDALIQAGPTKLKPIVMATVAIILGMLPLALGIGAAGKEMRIPLGIVSIGGLIASTFLTLFVIPAIYYIFTKTKIKRDKGKLPIS